MILASSDATLAELLTSSAAIAQTWPRAGDDVLLLVHILKISLPSLADALATGLVVLVTCSPRDAELTLSAGDAVLRGLAQDDLGGRIADPRRRAREVLQLQILDVVAEGRSAMKVA